MARGGGPDDGGVGRKYRVRGPVRRNGMADERARRIADAIAPLRVEPGKKVRLAKDFDPRYKAGLVHKKDGVDLLQTGVGLLADYQARLAAQDSYGLLVVLQAMDAAGKDGTIRHVMSGVNPQGVSVQQLQGAFERGSGPRLPVALFQRVSPERGQHRHLQSLSLRRGARRSCPPPTARTAEAAARPAPRPGGASGGHTVTARSTTGNTTSSKTASGWSSSSSTCRRRSSVGASSPHGVPEKNWKFSANDVKERRHWDEYQAAFSEMLSNEHQ